MKKINKQKIGKIIIAITTITILFATLLFTNMLILEIALLSNSVEIEELKELTNENILSLMYWTIDLLIINIGLIIYGTITELLNKIKKYYENQRTNEKTNNGICNNYRK